uniref:ABC transporter domain-containing protein n=1 Tax=Globisporangium ultimum (strain ATCC 200006 / CBS 805.95 / DAOM BR144) TaxID=431595 RepID=K3WV83_GLOUD
MTAATKVTDGASNAPVPETVINVGHKERAVSNAGVLSAAQIPKLTITWENINFNVKIKNPATKRFEEKKILQEVSGEAAPGELLVLMGPSGAGKSTLLDCISARNRQCTGNILVNGKKWSKGIARHSCYVMQDDLFYANLTVVEHLTFQAELRMSKISTKKERKERVLSIISELGLTKVRNTPIGDALVKGLSGGQRKRLSFATELLTNPSLLFVDEPTSGLDSFMAETVVILMRDLARMGRTVIATIHQPSSELFEVFDKLYLLVDGCTVYNGKASESIEYFGKQGLQCPSFMNPTDYFMKQLVVMDDQPGSRERVQKLVIAWQGHAHQRSQLKQGLTETSLALDKESEAEYAPGVATQTLVLCKRNWLRLVRDAIGFKARIASTLFITIMIGLIFLRLKHGQKGIQDFTGAIFFISVNQLFSSANPEFISVPLEIPLVLREHNGGLYNVLVWYFAKNISELPFQLFFPAIFLLPCYFMVGFGDKEPAIFFSFYLVISLICSCATGLGYMVSCLAKRVDLAPILGILFILPFLLFGGLFLNSDSTPNYLIWLQQISPIKYCFHALMRAYWSRIDSIACNASVERCLATTGKDVLANNSVKLDHMGFDCVILAVLNVAFRLIGAFFLWCRTDKRVSTN